MAINAPQQLNNADRLALRPLLVPRLTTIVANYALYIVNGGANADPNVANLRQWASNAIRNAGSVADQVSWHITNQASYLNGGTSIEDAELAGLAEVAIRAHFVNPLT